MFRVGITGIITIMIKALKSVLLFASLGLLAAIARGENENDIRGIVLSLEQDKATVSLEALGQVKKGDRARVDKIADEDRVETIRGEVVEVLETDAIIRIDSSRLEVGESVRIIPTAPMIEADVLASIPDDKFAQADGVDNDKLDRRAALEAVRAAIKEFPEEPRFHAQLGRLLEVLQKPASAILSYEAALEFEPEYPVALHNLASLRFFGPEELRDFEAARDLFRRAAELEFDASMPVIGSMSRDASGGSRDYEAAVHWFQIAAGKGNPYSQNALAQCYENAWGIDQDISKALLWYRSSAELDHAPAMWNLGRIFENGIGVTTNENTAFDWYGKAAERGHLEAIVSVGACYLEGRGIGQDTELAMELFNDASDKGSADAMRRLATIYMRGELVKKDYDLAAAFFRKAADKGDVSSQFNLAAMLEKGQGVERDKDAAIAWYQDAARQGHNSSQKRLLKLQVDW